MKKFLLFLLLFIINISAQNASDYFPAEQGFKWFFKTIPFDSLNNPVDSLMSYEIDSFAIDADYRGKLSHIVLSKYGGTDILQNPFLDSSYIHVETSNIWNYAKENLSFGLPLTYEGWYSVYRLNTSAPYNIFTKDTLVTFGTATVTLRFEVTGRKLSDEVLDTPYGTLNCKKFLLTLTVKYIPIIPIPITLLTNNDTSWIAPGYYIVKSVQPSSNVDLSLFGIPAFSIPGFTTEAISPPPVLNAEPGELNISSEGDSVFVFISNDGEGILNWGAEIMEGENWITFISSSTGTGNDSLFIEVSENDSSVLRKGLIKIAAEGAFNSPRFVVINQEAGVVSAEEINKPFKYSLGQNYPNPFNPSTTIEFSLTKPGNVKLVLYDMIGNEISIITSEYYSAGRHKVNYNSGRLSSGVYIYRIITEEFTSSGKMVLMK